MKLVLRLLIRCMKLLSNQVCHQYQLLKTVAIQINTRFLDVPLIDIIHYALSILFLFLFIGF